MLEEVHTVSFDTGVSEKGLVGAAASRPSWSRCVSRWVVDEDPIVVSARDRS